MSTTRRDFLKISTGSAAFFSTARSASLAANSPDKSGRVLVVLQLAGGNDGLNTVVPYEDDNYARNRSTLRLTQGQIHKIGSSSLGFHPELRGFARLFQEGHLSVLQGVGYPNMNRDHGAGMRHWQTGGVLTAAQQTGWLGRVADRSADADSGDVPAVFVGRIAPPAGDPRGAIRRAQHSCGT